MGQERDKRLKENTRRDGRVRVTYIQKDHGRVTGKRERTHTKPTNGTGGVAHLVRQKNTGRQKK